MTELKLQKTESPTIFNKEMAIGTLALGLLTGGMSLLAGSAIILGGALVGGFIGKSRMEKEVAEGKTVSNTPSFFNKNALIGALIGGMFSLTGLGTAAALALTFSTVALGSLIGGKLGQINERQEFAKAAAQQPQVFRQPGFDMDMSVAHAAEIERQRAQAAAQEKSR